MLAAIADLDPGEASSVLAEAARSVLADVSPELQHASVSRVDSELVRRVIEEIRQRVRRVPTGDTERDIALISDELSRAMSEFVLKGADLQTVRNRAGQRGTLPVGLYKINFTSHF